MPSNKPFPRFVPTLTEVVRTGVARPVPPLDRERQASPQWRREIETTVESVVARALAERGLDKL